MFSLVTDRAASSSSTSSLAQQHPPLGPNRIVDMLRRDAVAALFDDAQDVEWVGSSGTGHQSAADSDFMTDELLAAIGQLWREYR